MSGSAGRRERLRRQGDSADNVFRCSRRPGECGGGGDLKLLAALGLWITLPDLWLAVTIASARGLAWLLAASVATGRRERSLRFGPFVAPGAVVVVAI